MRNISPHIPTGFGTYGIQTYFAFFYNENTWIIMEQHYANYCCWYVIIQWVKLMWADKIVRSIDSRFSGIPTHCLWSSRSVLPFETGLNVCVYPSSSFRLNGVCIVFEVNGFCVPLWYWVGTWNGPECCAPTYFNISVDSQIELGEF